MQKKNQETLPCGKPTVISLFTGAMGLDLGFEAEGFEIRVANDIKEYVKKTIKRNRPHIPVINSDIRKLSVDEILERARLGAGEATVITGGPPCQAFSTAGKRRSINDKRRTRGGDLVFKFEEVIQEAKPKFFVFENVAGLKSAAIKHISFYERLKKKETKPEEALGSAFEKILEGFKKTRYYLSWGIVNAADYGAPQKRKRLIILGSRNGPPILPPPRTHVENTQEPMKNLKPWLTWDRSETRLSYPETAAKPKLWVNLRSALNGLEDPNPEYVEFPRWGKYLKYVPPGGCWVDIPEELQKEAMGEAYDTGEGEKAGKRGGRRGFYRRLSWDNPAPTLVTSPIMKATCLCHPEELRPLSVREYAKLQQFPDGWEFAGSTAAKYRQIGEAVPVGLARAIAQTIKQNLSPPKTLLLRS